MDVETDSLAIETLRITLDDTMEVSLHVEFCSSDVIFGEKFLTLNWSSLCFNVQDVKTCLQLLLPGDAPKIST